MKYKLILTILITFITLSINPITAIDEINLEQETNLINLEQDTNLTNQIILQQGKNNITTQKEFSTIYVKDFVKLFPEIEVISYTENNNTIGYINYFNGIGENFLIYPEKEYEIITKSQLTIEIQ